MINNYDKGDINICNNNIDNNFTNYDNDTGGDRSKITPIIISEIIIILKVIIIMFVIDNKDIKDNDDDDLYSVDHDGDNNNNDIFKKIYKISYRDNWRRWYYERENLFILLKLLNEFLRLRQKQ